MRPGTEDRGPGILRAPGMAHLSVRLAGAFFAGIALVAGAAQAQADLTAPGPEGAEAAVHAYTSAFATADWEAAGRVIDPDELVVMADLVAFLVQMDTTDQTRGLIDEDGEPDNVRLFARFMETMTGMEPMMADALTSMQFEILGSVSEGDSLVHVVGRSTTQMFGAEVDNVEVTSVRWLGDRWAVKLDEQLRGMTQAMTQFSEIMREEDSDTILEEDWDNEEDGDDEDGVDEDGSGG